MTRHKLTILLLSPKGGPAKAVSVTPPFLIALGTLAAVLFLTLAWGIYSYFQLKTEILYLTDLQHFAEMQDQMVATAAPLPDACPPADHLSDHLSDQISEDSTGTNLAMLTESGAASRRSDLLGVGGSPLEDTDPRQVIRVLHKIKVQTIDNGPDYSASIDGSRRDGTDQLIHDMERSDGQLSRLPVSGTITSRFGWRRSPFGRRSEFHKGLDIAAPRGTPVYAPADGRVIFAGRQGPLGKLVEISHGNGLTTRYAHLHRYLKKTGESVKKGEQIGLVGNTGRSTGPHLHYEIRKNNRPINPFQVVLK